MTAIPHWSTFDASTATATGTTYVDCVSHTFEAADQVVGKTYAVFWKTAVELSSTTVWARVRVLQDATEVALVQSEGKEISVPPDRVQRSGFFFFTPAGAPADVTFKVQVASSSAGVIHEAFNHSIVIIELPTNSVTAEVTAEQTITSSTTFTDLTGSSISVAGEYLFLVSSEVRSANTSGLEVGISIDGASPAAVGWSSNKDSTHYSSLMVAHKATASSAAKIQFRQTVSNATAGRIANTRFLALKITDFRNIFHGALAADSTGTQSSYTTAVTLTETASAGDHLLIGTMYAMMDASTTISMFTELTSGGSTVDEHIHEASNTTAKSGGVPSGSISHLETLSAGSRTWLLRRRAEAGVNSNTLSANSSISVIDLDAPSSGTSGPVGLATEADSAFALGSARPAGLGTETDSAFARPGLSIRTVGLASETGTAFALVPRQVRTTGVATEAETAFPRGAVRPVGLGTESGLGLALTAKAIRPVGTGSETDTTFALVARQVRAVGLASETDAAFAASVAVGVSIETDSALALTSVQRRAVGIALEASSAFIRAAVASKAVGAASETNSAFALRWRATVGIASETEEAFALVRLAGWDYVQPAPGTWDLANDAGGAWSNVAAAGGSWLDDANPSGLWTPLPPASGVWN